MAIATISYSHASCLTDGEVAGTIAHADDADAPAPGTSCEVLHPAGMYHLVFVERHTSGERSAWVLLGAGGADRERRKQEGYAKVTFAASHFSWLEDDIAVL